MSFQIFKSSKNLLILACCLAGSSTIAQPEHKTISTATIPRPTTLQEEAIFTINQPTSNQYTIEASLLDEPQSQVTFEAGSEILLTGEFLVEEGATFCMLLNPAGDNFARLKDQLDGSFYTVKNGVLRILIQEDYYADAETVTLKIYDQSDNQVFSNSQITKNAGINGFELNLHELSAFVAGNFYLVEVINKKNIKKVLRIKYPNNSAP